MPNKNCVAPNFLIFVPVISVTDSGLVDVVVVVVGMCHIGG